MGDRLMAAPRLKNDERHERARGKTNRVFLFWLPNQGLSYLSISPVTDLDVIV